MAHLIFGAKSIMHRLWTAGMFLKGITEAMTQQSVATMRYGASGYDWD